MTHRSTSVFSRRRGLRLFGMAAVSGLLAACQQAAPTAPPAAATQPPAAPKAASTTAPTPAPAANAKPAAPTAAPVVTTPQPKTGGSMINQLGSDPTMNPVTGPDSASNIVNAAIFNQLTRVDKDTLQPSPDLATKWQADPDALAWTFTLRQGVKWHDGQPFTADDVKFTFDTILDPATNTRLRGDFSVIKEVIVVDPGTVRFTLKKPFAPFPVFTGYTAGIVPKHILQGHDINTASDFNSKNPIGTGPFKIQKYTSGSDVTLAANPDYFRGRPKLDTLTYKIVPDTNAIIAQLNTGELEFARLLPPDLQGVQNPDITIYSANFMGWFYFGPNITNPLFKDKRVRQALAYGIDRQAMNKAVNLDKFTLSSGPIPPFLKPWHDDTLQPYGYDPNKATSLLADAGWTPGSDGILQKDGQPFRFKLSWGKDPKMDPGAVFVQQYLKKMGMDVTADGQEWNAYIKRFEDRDFESVLDGWVAPYDPDVYSYFHSSAAKGGKNISQYASPDADALLEQGRAETDATKRRDIYIKLQQLLYEDQPTIFIWHQPELQARSKKLSGLPPIAVALGDFYNYTDEFTRAG
jgi:peptide/nickel transport system substrate-binding protein